jgi:phosphoglycolate phosphatase-like HAD superfamily hydrolase
MNSSQNKLARANSIVFDCDGVLIDASQSYNKAIADSSAYLLSAFLGNRFPSSTITEDVIFAFRQTGGFNNDCNTTYSIVLFVMSNVPEKFLNAYRSIFAKATKDQPDDPYSRLKLANEMIAQDRIKVEFEQKAMTSKIIEFAGMLDTRGIKSTEEAVLKGSGRSAQMTKSLKKFLRYPGDVSISIITSVFDEYFYGRELFRKVHGIDGRLGIKRGGIQNEKIIVDKIALDKLRELFGNSMGIATGRGSIGTLFTLRNIKNYLNPSAMVFLEDMDPKILEEKKYGKPEPYALLKASERFDGESVVYVGDSAEDLIMARKAGKAGRDFVFAAVRGKDSLSERRLDLFVKEKADVIVRSVNDLPFLFKRFRN